MAWCFRTRASVVTLMPMYPCISSCFRVHYAYQLFAPSNKCEEININADINQYSLITTKRLYNMVAADLHTQKVSQYFAARSHWPFQGLLYKKHFCLPGFHNFAFLTANHTCAGRWLCKNLLAYVAVFLAPGHWVGGILSPAFWNNLSSGQQCWF